MWNLWRFTGGCRESTKTFNQPINMDVQQQRGGWAGEMVFSKATGQESWWAEERGKSVPILSSWATGSECCPNLRFIEDKTQPHCPHRGGERGLFSSQIKGNNSISTCSNNKPENTAQYISPLVLVPAYIFVNWSTNHIPKQESNFFGFVPSLYTNSFYISLHQDSFIGATEAVTFLS